MTHRFARIIVPVAAIVAASLTAAAASAADTNPHGVTGPAIYVDGQAYRTVGTPTDFSGTGAPEHSFDTIYDLSSASAPGQLNVAAAAPGDRDFNGGRWMVHAIAFSNYAGALADQAVDMNGNGVLDSDAEVLAAIDGGYASDLGIVKHFECPIIRVPSGR